MDTILAGGTTDFKMGWPNVYMTLADEFFNGLIKLRKKRRGACIYTLKHAMDPADVTELTWSKLVLTDQPLACMKVFNAARAGRHL